VYDGHGGTHAAEFTAHHLHTNIVEHASFDSDPVVAIREGFQKTEKQFEKESLDKKVHGGVGTTACVCIVIDQTLYVANVGDSAAVLCRNVAPVPLTQAHTLSNPAERERVSKVGAVICENRLGHPLWNPNFIHIGVTRAIGDFYFKLDEWCKGKQSGLIAEPDIKKWQLTGDDFFILLASDGFWDVVTPMQAVLFVSKEAATPLDELCKKLVDLALRRSTLDNTTVVLVKLQELAGLKNRIPPEAVQSEAPAPSSNNNSASFDRKRSSESLPSGLPSAKRTASMGFRLGDPNETISFGSSSSSSSTTTTSKEKKK